ncbi:hypothetical protein BaRGS_00025506 [Batillaria attramentaria]|uniref:Uncharacterized protein n=1 Tax=Batillaria attramentaria TaxID=370345 RepID=A0ABD0K804_9CAEN
MTALEGRGGQRKSTRGQKTSVELLCGPGERPGSSLDLTDPKGLRVESPLAGEAGWRVVSAFCSRTDYHYRCLSVVHSMVIQLVVLHT